MPRLYYGNSGQVHFNNLTEYYTALGFLANPRHAEIRWEHNEEQGAWGSEGRIHCLVPTSNFPPNFRFTAGRGNVYARINCNDFVQNLVINHNFSYNQRFHNRSAIYSTVPKEYQNAFWAGYDGCF